MLLSMKWRSTGKMQEHRSLTRLAMQEVLLSRHGFIESYLYSLQTSCVLSQVLPPQSITWVCLSKIILESVSHDLSLLSLFSYKEINLGLFGDSVIFLSSSLLGKKNLFIAKNLLLSPTLKKTLWLSAPSDCPSFCSPHRKQHGCTRPSSSPLGLPKLEYPRTGTVCLLETPLPSIRYTLSTFPLKSQPLKVTTHCLSFICVLWHL